MGAPIKKSDDPSNINNKNEISITKLNLDGDPIWNKVYSFGVNDYGKTITETNDGTGFVVGGYSYIDTGGFKPNAEALLFRINANGDTLWSRVYGKEHPKGRGYISCIVPDYNMGYIVTGFSPSIFNDNNLINAIFITKIDEHGDSTWLKKVDGKYRSVKQYFKNKTGGFTLTGCYENYDIHHYNDNFQEKWMSSIMEDNQGTTVFADNGYIVASNKVLIKVSTNGIKQWIKRHEGNDVSIIQTNDGGFLITGTANQKIFVLKTDQDGNTFK